MALVGRQAARYGNMSMTTRSEPDFQFELNFTRNLARAIDSARSLTVFLLIENEEWDQLLGLKIEWRDYQDAGTFADDYLITSILKKSVNIPLILDRKLEAYLGFFESEHTNRLTNERFSITSAVDHPEWWWRCEKYLRKMMGPLDKTQLDRIISLAKHGPGAVVGLGRSVRVPSSKFDIRPTVTSRLAPFLNSLMGPTWTDYHTLGGGPTICDSNRLSTALKNAMTDRSTCTGVHMNVFGQLGAGRHLAERLKLFGIDIRDQGLNQWLSSKAEEWRLATIDLSNASNTMAKVPILQLVSDRWGHLLSILREEFVSSDLLGMTGKRQYELEMLCAMGNGYTFPLETMLFLSVVRAIVPPKLHWCTSVYGDDIICPQEYATDVITALEYLGFSANTSKSCLAGSFFESCGTDWLFGHNVRPFYLRRTEDDETVDVQTPDGFRIPYPVQAGNALRLWSKRRAAIDGKDGCDVRFEPLWRALVDQVPRDWQMPVPPSLGDSGLVCSFSETHTIKWNVRPKDLRTVDVFQKTVLSGWEGYAVKHMVLSPVKADQKSFGVVLSNVGHATPMTALELVRRWRVDRVTALQIRTEVDNALEATLGAEPVRGLFGRPRARWAFIQYWPDGLSWV